MSRLQATLLLTVLVLACALTWQVQGWRLGRQLAQQQQAFALERQQLAESTAAELQGERQQRRVLERELDLNDHTHYQELLDVQQAQARLRDRLATADLRLSVLIDRGATPDLPATPGTGSLDHGPARAGLDPAHARRIIAITDAGDAGLIALRACQGYVRSLTP
ncbi:lysis system i-spanin subunit Rz [Pseudomonas aegrilactucae]|uniref:Lysis protein n=1 Tax=Pseudomonas aegrilactucae TaxID=2854028 RepID=A0A9Q2XKS0_9PSED|nr:lysis system i-spanin subunit Rz [Pseudomonas aegrilactucae]MBV6288508.1 lysis protein [Pseudomonas aegrilactucae]